MRDCLCTLTRRGNSVDVKTLIQLAEEFGLPCIERDGCISIAGLEQILEFHFNGFHFINLEELHDD